MLVIFLLLSFYASAHSVPLTFSPGGGLSSDLSSEHLPDNFKLRKNTYFSPVGGMRILVFSGKFKLRTGVFGEYKSVSAERTDPSLFDNDINASALYGVIPLGLQFSPSEKFYTFVGLSPHLLILKSCSNDSAPPQGCGRFSDASKFVNYSQLGFGSSHLGVDVELNYQHALSDNYDGLKIHSLQIMILGKM